VSNSTKAAERNVRALAVIKWLVVGAWLVYGLFACVAIGLAETWPEWTLYLQPVVAVASILSALLSWVLIGWFQHMLATNVAIAAGNYRVPGVGTVTRVDPDATYATGEPTHFGVNG
jgi:cytochrome c biogenesis protein CcdA